MTDFYLGDHLLTSVALWPPAIDSVVELRYGGQVHRFKVVKVCYFVAPSAAVTGEHHRVDLEELEEDRAHP